MCEMTQGLLLSSSHSDTETGAPAQNPPKPRAPIVFLNWFYIYIVVKYTYHKFPVIPTTTVALSTLTLWGSHLQVPRAWV